MATNPMNPDDPAERRISLRRARSAGGNGGFSNGISTSTESYRGDEDDDDDDLRDTPVQRLGPPTEPDSGLSQSMMNVSMAGSRSYAKEYRLKQMHRLLMRGVSLDLIARELKISISTAEKDRVELKRMLRERARQMDINELIGDQTGFYDEIKALALRTVSTDAPNMVKLAAMRTALASQADYTRFLTNAGVFDVLAYRRAEDGGNLSDVQTLMQSADNMIQTLLAAEQAEQDRGPDPKPPIPPRLIRRVKPSGFKPMQFEDNGGSSGDNEVQEL